jgi:hypothetical protein
VPDLVSQQPPPPDYYAGNLRRLLTDVQERCRSLLSAEEIEFIRACLSAPVPAQRLFARLLSRRGPWLRMDRVSYPEVPDSDAALRQLCRAGLVAVEPVAPADALLNLFTRPELSALFPAVSGRTKSDWIAACVGRYPDGAIRRRLRQRSGWLCVAHWHAYSICRLLYFGDLRQDLSAFVVQDLGILRYESYELSDRTRPFDCRGQVEGYLRLRGLAALCTELQRMPALGPRLLERLWEAPASRVELRLRDKVLLRLGRWHERRGELDAALQCYGRAGSHPGRERRARLLRRLGDEMGVSALLTEMAAEPWSGEEEDFARRFAGRGRNASAGPRRRTDLPVTLLRAAPAPASAVEIQGARLLAANVGCGWHLENRFPLGLAGLLFWDEIYAPVKGAFTNPFQLGPRDLFWPDFAAARRRLLSARVASLQQPGAVAARLNAVRAAKLGIANPLVHWHAFDPALIRSLTECVPQSALLRLARHTVENLHRLRTGFPDLLMIYGPGAYEFVEVKGPTDQLQPAQRTWLRALAGLGLPARVLRFQP